MTLTNLYFSLSVTLIVLLLWIGAYGQSSTSPLPPPPVAEYNSANWKAFKSTEGGFTVAMPGVPGASSETVDTNAGPIVMHLFVVDTSLGEYGVSYADLPVKSNDPALVRRLLDGSRDEMLANGATRLNENDVTLAGIIGRELIVERAGFIGRHRTFLVDGRLYAVILATAANVAFKNGKPSPNPDDRSDLYEKTCSQFFDSFRFIERSGPAAVPEGARAADDQVLDTVSARTDLYPANADAKKKIDDALKQAAGEKKRVMLVFGANWCYDCHVLDRALHEGAAGKVVQESFLVVHVDIGEGDKNLDLAKKYKIPIEKGVPAVAVVGSDGTLLYSSGAGEFEAARRMMKKDLVAFLTQWKKPK
jgi:hypothetical protein